MEYKKTSLTQYDSAYMYSRLASSSYIQQYADIKNHILGPQSLRKQCCGDWFSKPPWFKGCPNVFVHSTNDILWNGTRIGHHNIGFWDPEDHKKDVLKSFTVIFDVEILLKKWPTGQATIYKAWRPMQCIHKSQSQTLILWMDSHFEISWCLLC